MKHIYIRFIISFILLTAINPRKSFSQCPHGYVPDGVAFDTTINFTSGRHTSELKFPKFDPQVGMVTCAKLTMEMTGTLNTLYFENFDASSKSAEATFTRKDTITGPGLTSPLLNSETDNYGPYTLGPYDGVPNSGVDYFGIGPEQIFTRSTSFVITNLADLAIFYGPVGDSLTYNYNAESKTTINIPGNWLGGVITTGSVTYKLEYCYCPVSILPVNAYDFNVKKIDNDKAQLTWKANNDAGNYYYEIEYSNDGSNFTRVDIVEKQSVNSASISYNYLFTKNKVDSKYFFRIKQKFINGKALISSIKSIDFKESILSQFSLYPNPSNGIVGIKFDKYINGKILVNITNVNGQTIINKEIEITDGNYRQIGMLQRGVYWVKMTDVASQKTWVNQLLIK
ncbi:MAG: choice-of-anchor E domain-containing protein [Bacteroidota bacterium]